MKFGYAIVLALVALVAVSGFASADRLPSQVPENQIFTIDTLIDVTGAVSEESEMQWTLDDQNLEHTKAVGSATGNVTLAQIAANFGTNDAQALYDALVGTTGVTLKNTSTGGYVTYYDIPANLYNTLVACTLF